MAMSSIVFMVVVLGVCQAAVLPASLTVKETQKLTFKVITQFTKQSTWQIITGPKKQSKMSLQKLTDPAANKDEVRDEVYSWWSQPIGSDLYDDITLLSDVVASSNYTTICRHKTYQFLKSGYLTMNIDQPQSVLYPGSFIQGKSIKTGAEPLERLAIGSTDRFPIQISSIGGYVDEAFPTADIVLQTIRKNLAIQKNDVWVGFVKSQDLPSVYESLNFNSRVTEKLGISSVSPIKSDRIYVFMLQMINEYYPAMLSPDESFVEDAIGVFLKNTFTLEKALKLKNLKLWGPNNIPCYVDRVFYGRFLGISVAFNKKNQQIYQEFTTNSELDSDRASELLTQMFTDPTMLAYGKGPFAKLETEDVKAGAWYKFFSELPPFDPKSKALIEPIVFSLKDFREQSVKFSNAIKYKIEECVPREYYDSSPH